MAYPSELQIERKCSRTRRPAWPLAAPRRGPLVVGVLGLLVSSAAFSGAQTFTLETGAAAAIQRSPLVRAAKAVREAALTHAERGRPVARPTLDARVSGTLQGPRTTLPRPDGSSASVLPEEFARLGLLFEQPLYRAGAGAARDRYGAAQGEADWEYRRAVGAVSLAARKAYIDVLRAESGLTVAKDALAAAESTRALVKAQVAAGIARPIDVDGAESRTGEAQTAVTGAASALALARMSFNRTLGRPLDADFALASLPAPAAAPASPVAAVETAWRQRPELKLLDESLRGARAAVDLVKSQSQPSVKLRGEISEQTPTLFVREHYAAATVELTWPILDGGKSRLDIREARAQADRIEALREDARQGVAIEVTQYWLQLRDGAERLVRIRSQRRAAERAAAVAQQSYRVGRGTLLDVQAAQREVFAVQASEAQALYDLHAAAVDFAHAQGEETP